VIEKLLVMIFKGIGYLFIYFVFLAKVCREIMDLDIKIEFIPPISDDVLREDILKFISERMGIVTLRELKSRFSGVVSENRLRKLIYELVEEGILKQVNRGVYILNNK